MKGEWWTKRRVGAKRCFNTLKKSKILCIAVVLRFSVEIAGFLKVFGGVFPSNQREKWGFFWG